MFFQTYKALRGQTYEVLGVGGRQRAIDIIEEAAERLKAEQNKEGA